MSRDEKCGEWRKSFPRKTLGGERGESGEKIKSEKERKKGKMERKEEEDWAKYLISIISSMLLIM